jgi:DnaJ domain
MEKTPKAIAESASGCQSVQQWLKKAVRIELLCNFLVLVGLCIVETALLALTVGLVFLGLLFCYFMAESVVGLFGIVVPRPYYSLFLPISTGVTVVLIFASYFRNGEVDFGEISRVGMMSNPARPNIWFAGAKLVVSCLYSAPQMAELTWNSAAKFFRLCRLDTNECAKILTVLASSGGALTYREIFQQIENLNPVIVFPQLKSIEGVLFLFGTGKLTMTPGLKAEIRGILGFSESGERKFEQSDAGGFEHLKNERMGNYQVLGVRPTISLVELKNVYRKLMKANHPDLVSKAGQEELKSLAEERTKQINEAYRAILEERGIH